MKLRSENNGEMSERNEKTFEEGSEGGRKRERLERILEGSEKQKKF